MKLICLIFVFLLSSCNHSYSRVHIVDFSGKNFPGKFSVSSLSSSRSCHYFECGEVSTKTIGLWYEFSYSEHGKSRGIYPLVECTNSDIGLDKPVRFKFCGNIFVLIDYADQMTIDGKKANGYKCVAIFIVRI